MTDLNVALILRFIDQASGPARNAMRTLQGAAERMDRMGAAQLAAGRAQVELAGRQMTALRGQALAVAGVGYAAYAALRPAMEFEAQMSRVGAVARASAEDQQRLTATARELGRSTPFSARQAAQGMEFLAMAGFNVNQTIAAMPGLLNLASAAGSDLGRTSDIASNILSGFELQASETGQVADVLVNTFTSSNTTLEMLGSTMSYVAPQAVAMGVGLEQVAAMAGQLGNTGIQGERAGTALRAMLSRLVAPSSEAAAALAELNVQVSDEHGNLRDVPTILAEMDRAMRGLGEADRLAVMNTIYGTEAASAALYLTTQAGSGALQTYAAQLEETGTAARVAGQMNDNAQGALRRLSSAAEGARIALGNRMLPVLADLAERLIPIISGAEQWIEAHQGLVSTGVKVAAALLAINAASLVLRGGFWLLFGWIGRARIALGLLMRFGGNFLVGFVRGALSEFGRRSLGISTSVSRLGWAARFLSGSLGSLSSVVGALATAAAGISAPVWTAIAVGVAAVAAAALGLWKYWDRIRAVLAGVAARISEELRPALDWLAGRAADLLSYLQPLTDWMQGVFAPVIARFAAGWETARQTMASFGGYISSFFDRELLTDDQREAWHRAGYDFTDRMIGGIHSGLAALWAAGARMIQSLWDGAVARFQAMMEWLRGIPAAIVGAIGDISLGGVFTGAPSGVSSDPAERNAASVRGQSLGYGVPVTPFQGPRAIGGPVRPGFWYQVNEQGIEGIMPLSPMRVVPTGEMRGAARGGGRVAGGLTIGGITINALPGMDAEAVARAVRREIDALAREARFALNDGGLHA